VRNGFQTSALNRVCSAAWAGEEFLRVETAPHSHSARTTEMTLQSLASFPFRGSNSQIQGLIRALSAVVRRRVTGMKREGFRPVSIAFSFKVLVGDFAKAGSS